MTAHQAPSDRVMLGELAPRLQTIGIALGAVGIIASLVIAAVTKDWSHFFRAYTTAFMFVTSICLGALFFVLIQHATRAGWGTVVRRLAEGVAANFAWLWVLFIPVAATVFMAHPLYHWVHPEGDALLEHKEAFLNVPFWLIRSALYLGIWAFLGMFYFRNSVAQDATGDVNLTHRMQRLAPVGCLLFALTLTFAAVDWVMSLEAHWFSTMFGVYFFAASCCGYFSLQIIMAWYLQRSGRLENEITLEHYQDMGKLLFAFGIVFWAYIAYSQFMLIWYANIPEETTWYMARTLGPWRTVSWILLVFHFAVPFVLLVTKHTKRVPAVLAGIAGLMLVLHFVDMYWSVMPRVPEQLSARTESLATLTALYEQGELNIGWAPSPMDLTLVLGLVGLLVAGTARGLSKCALYPLRDPRLGESMAFENV